MEPEGSVPRYSREGLFFYAHFTEVTDIRKLKKYTPTPFMAKRSHYDKALADYAVSFIQCLCHTKGTWAGKPFELIDWQERIIRDLFGVVKENGYRQFNTAYIEIPKKWASRSWPLQWRFCSPAAMGRNARKCMAVPLTDSRPPLFLRWRRIWCGCARR